MNPEQRRIEVLARNLLATLDALVPDSTAHYVVEANRLWLELLIRDVGMVRTAPPHTWTFCGHWHGDQLVIDYSVPGEVQDDRPDDGQHPEGLWAASASGETEAEAARAAVSAYVGGDPA